MVRIIVTCEHGGNKIPKPYQHHFAHHKNHLNSHRGFDAGALQLAKIIAKISDTPLFYSETSRLLVDINRSVHHNKLFSAVSRSFNKQQKEEILNKYYFPYRNSVESDMSKLISSKQKVLHLSVHTFVPVLDKVKRNVDIGFLYDPVKKTEKELCKKWADHLRVMDADLLIRFNSPYKGKSDGFTTYLRKKYLRNYMGIELEVNQKFSINSGNTWKTLCKKIAFSLCKIIMM